ncbi:hypothetical protein AB0L67_36695 [Streptomyces flaveolus]|uniref:hypothetical protein n=1 Tax=Streptomyces flaveolus TaxID=67297 RepID=UPI00343A9F3A
MRAGRLAFERLQQSLARRRGAGALEAALQGVEYERPTGAEQGSAAAGGYRSRCRHAGSSMLSAPYS